MPRLSVNTALLKYMTVLKACTPPPEPVDATLNVKRVPVSTKSVDSMEDIAPENVGRINTDA